MNLLIMRR